MDNESMYAELLELITTDSASGKESAIARLLISKLEALGFAVTMDNAGETLGGERGNVLGVRESELDGALLFLLNNKAASFITGVVIPIDGGFSAYSGV